MWVNVMIGEPRLYGLWSRTSSNWVTRSHIFSSTHTYTLWRDTYQQLEHINCRLFSHHTSCDFHYTSLLVRIGEPHFRQRTGAEWRQETLSLLKCVLQDADDDRWASSSSSRTQKIAVEYLEAWVRHESKPCFQDECRTTHKDLTISQFHRLVCTERVFESIAISSSICWYKIRIFISNSNTRYSRYEWLYASQSQVLLRHLVSTVEARYAHPDKDQCLSGVVSARPC